MGRYCQICARERPHERFGGRGYAARVCRDCRQLPKEEQRRLLATDEIWGFMFQSNISEKNIARLRTLESINETEFQLLRELILEIALTKPRRSQRWKFLREHRPDLLLRSVDAGLADDVPTLELWGCYDFDTLDFQIADTSDES